MILLPTSIPYLTTPSVHSVYSVVLPLHTFRAFAAAWASFQDSAYGLGSLAALA